jgi:hypothetical protein
LLTQLVRPLVGATCRRPVEEPLIGEFGCSGRFAASCLEQELWDPGRNREGVEIWLTVAALTGDFQPCQAYLGPRTIAPAPRPGLRELFPLVVGALFDCLDRFATRWQPLEGREPLPIFGAEQRPATEAPPPTPAALGASFARDVRDLEPVLASILAPATLARLREIVDSGAETLHYADDLWVATVYDFLAAYHRGVMDRAHITQALMPLYLGRAASFLNQYAAEGASGALKGLEQMSREFELARPFLIEHWTRKP